MPQLLLPAIFLARLAGDARGDEAVAQAPADTPRNHEAAAAPRAAEAAAAPRAAEAAAAPRAAEAALRWAVIVHPSSQRRSIPRAELERIYLRKEHFWPDGNAIVALNLPSADPLRLAFSTEVLHSDPEQLATYWNREYFQGVRPPIVLQSAAAVRAYVAATPAAIGYIDEAAVDATVTAIRVSDGH